jgi:hypothetical protein
LTTRRQGFEAVRTSGAFTAVLVHVDYDEWVPKLEVERGWTQIRKKKTIKI